MKTAVLLLVAVMAAAAPARADWQFTKWGMTPGEVVKASAGKVVPLSPEDGKADSAEDGSEIALLGMRYDTPDFGFNAVFSFGRDGRLCGVRLHLVRGDGAALLPALRAKYGSPSDPTLIADDWFSGPDHIVGLRLGAETEVLYQPRTSGASTGL